MLFLFSPSFMFKNPKDKHYPCHIMNSFTSLPLRRCQKFSGADQSASFFLLPSTLEGRLCFAFEIPLQSFACSYHPASSLTACLADQLSSQCVLLWLFVHSKPCRVVLVAPSLLEVLRVPVSHLCSASSFQILSSQHFRVLQEESVSSCQKLQERGGTQLLQPFSFRDQGSIGPEESCYVERSLIQTSSIK